MPHCHGRSLNLMPGSRLKVLRNRLFEQSRTHDDQEKGMPKPNKDFNQPQQQTTKPPRADEDARQKQKAQEQEVAGRHKNDGQNDHKGNRRQPGSHRGNS